MTFQSVVSRLADYGQPNINFWVPNPSLFGTSCTCIPQNITPDLRKGETGFNVLLPLLHNGPENF